MLEIQLSRLDVIENHAEGEMWEFTVDSTVARTDLLVSSVRVWKINDSHSGVRFWNRGRGTASEWAIVGTKDALAIVARLFGLTLVEFANGVAFSLKNTFLIPLG
jgi:hypothetical protein